MVAGTHGLRLTESHRHLQRYQELGAISLTGAKRGVTVSISVVFITNFYLKFKFLTVFLIALLAVASFESRN